MAQLREVKRRIKTSKNISQVTRAMETVSAVKMRKAKDAAVIGKEYTNTLMQMMRVLAGQIQEEDEDQKSIFLREPTEIKNILLIVIAPKKGLCGSLIGNLQRMVANFVLRNETYKNVNFSFLTIGKKSNDIVKVFGKDVLADFEINERDLDVNAIESIVDFSVRELESKTTDAIFVAYTEFINTMTQKPTIKQFLPIPALDLEKTDEQSSVLFVFEPSSAEVLESLVVRYTKSILYQFLLESIASEHAARMVAMKSAHDSADDIVSDLSLFYNKMRQDSITTELADSVSIRLGQE